jgi:hypothetical protein
MKIQSLSDLEGEMRDVAQGKRVAADDAAAASAESTDEHWRRPRINGLASLYKR